MFYPVCLNLKEEDAGHVVRNLIDDAERLGGALTVNWHDRSIAPERLWDDFYLELPDELKSREPGCLPPLRPLRGLESGAQRKWSIRVGESAIRIRGRIETSDKLPGLTIRINKPRVRTDAAPIATSSAAEFVNMPFRWHHGTGCCDMTEKASIRRPVSA
jgi:hypothetical protein